MKTSMKEVRLHAPEAKRNRANTLSTRLLACCKTSINKAVNVKQLISGIKAHKFIGKLPLMFGAPTKIVAILHIISNSASYRLGVDQVGILYTCFP